MRATMLMKMCLFRQTLRLKPQLIMIVNLAKIKTLMEICLLRLILVMNAAVLRRFFFPLISSHIAKYGNKGKGIKDLISCNKITVPKCNIYPDRASYLSDTICDEFIT